jgi:hypothetical protein
MSFSCKYFHKATPLFYQNTLMKQGRNYEDIAKTIHIFPCAILHSFFTSGMYDVRHKDWISNERDQQENNTQCVN